MQFLIIFNRLNLRYSVSSSFCSCDSLTVKGLKQFLTKFFDSDFLKYSVKDIPARINSISPFICERVNYNI